MVMYGLSLTVMIETIMDILLHNTNFEQAVRETISFEV